MKVGPFQSTMYFSSSPQSLPLPIVLCAPYFTNLLAFLVSLSMQVCNPSCERIIATTESWSITTGGWGALSRKTAGTDGLGALQVFIIPELSRSHHLIEIQVLCATGLRGWENREESSCLSFLSAQVFNDLFKQGKPSNSKTSSM